MNRILLFSVFMFSLSIIGCKDDPVIPNEEEVITTLTYTLSSAGSNDVVLTFKDLDGDGGNDPEITGGTLEANKTYSGAIILLNEQEDPAEDITLEVAEEDDEHQFFFETDISGLSFAYGDKDDDDNPIGILSSLTTGDAASGKITVILRHEPDKSATGVSDGDKTNAGGETDIEVTFAVNVE